MGKIPMILIPFFFLIAVGSIIIFLFFPELAEVLHYENSQHFFLQHLLVVGLGTGFLVIFYRLKGLKWFDIIGVTILGVSLLLLTALLFFPALKVSGSILQAGYFSVNPTLLFTVSVLWFVDYLYRYGLGGYRWLLWSFTPVVALSWLYTIILYAPTAMLLGLTVLAVLFFVHKHYKTFYVLFAAFIGLFILLVFSSPHRVNRIRSWIEVLNGEREYAPPSGLDYTVSKLHDGLFIYNEWSTAVFAIVVSLFVWLIVALWKSDDMFAKSVAILFSLDILLHFVVFMNWSPIKPPTLFIVEQGVSITLVSFLMIGMVLMRLNKRMSQKL